jgi:hypothetical protein
MAQALTRTLRQVKTKNGAVVYFRIKAQRNSKTGEDYHWYEVGALRYAGRTTTPSLEDAKAAFEKLIQDFGGEV